MISHVHWPATTGHHYTFGQILAVNAVVAALAITAFATCVGPSTVDDDFGVARTDSSLANHTLLTILFNVERQAALRAHQPLYGTPAWRERQALRAKAKIHKSHRLADAMTQVD
jgi:hypothetical protein